ncbi:DUF2061 domain-containing protein [Novosphingobium lentum]|uniref:DUF2061 domain-containing protein n=1 Tax=Novosphingobium lentum TaxID=145287 RepID=UPI00083499F4|nr:DUF2061 domain-containing protein [Novosphingobium lentum]
MFLFRGHETHSRSIVKAASWRALGSIDTFVLSFIFSGNAKIAASIAGTEVITKIALYYFHERAWSLVHWGFKPETLPPEMAAAADDELEHAPT